MQNLHLYRPSLQNKDIRYNFYGCVHFIELTDRQQLSKKGFHYRIEIKEIRWDIAEAIANYFPGNALDEIIKMINKHKVILIISTPLKETSGVHCDRIIRINNDLPPNKFLEVFLHEYAHLLQGLPIPFFRPTAAHGAEFYYCFEQILLHFTHKEILFKDRFIPVLNFQNNYQLYKNRGFTFALNSIGLGSHFKFSNETFLRGKGLKGLIECTRIAEGTKIKLVSETKVQPVLDLSW